MSTDAEIIQRAIARRINDYRQTFNAPTEATVAKWRRLEEERLAMRGQMKFNFGEEFADDTKE